MIDLIAPEKVPVAVEIAVILQMAALPGMPTRKESLFVCPVDISGSVVVSVAREKGRGPVLISAQIFHKVGKC